jgi:hypothetical protein
MKIKEEEYVRIVFETKTGQWQSVRLSNLAKEMTSQQANRCWNLLYPKLLADAEHSVVRCKDLDVPEIIMEGWMSIVAKLKRYKHSQLARLEKRAGTFFKNEFLGE